MIKVLFWGKVEKSDNSNLVENGELFLPVGDTYRFVLRI
jgi:hypothetical protein